MSTPSRPRMLLVGAYERDNFGDLLFLLQTEQYLPDVELVAAAPVAGDMTALLDRRVPAYGPLLETERFDHIWTVGGEVGATSPMAAYRMSVPPETYAAYEAASDAERKVMLAEAFGSTPIDSPYVPRPTAYPRNALSGLTLNSVGIAGLRDQGVDRQDTVVSILRLADNLSVRDKLSSEFLTQQGVAHTLAPDLVHSIAVTRRREPAPPSDVVLVQISDAHLNKFGHDAFAEALARSANLAPYRIRLFLAGTARGHDSVASYERIMARFSAIAPERPIDISQARRPWDLVDEIRAAKLWIGLSLHGRIVSCAYGVPRISLVKRKLNAYSETWDPHMPYGVTAETLDEAVGVALSPETIAKSAHLGQELGEMADANIRAMVQQVLEGPPRDRTEERFAALEDWRARQVARRDRQIRRLREQLEASKQPAPPPASPTPSRPRQLLAGARRRLGRALPLRR